MDNYYSLRTIKVLLVLLVVGIAPVFGQEPAGPAEDVQQRPAFRYVIIENRLDTFSYMTQKHRVVEVLMDEKSFSERNLRVLFELMSRRFPHEDLLDVWVHTSLDQAPTPEERDLGGTSGGDGPGFIGRYYWAVYVRTREHENFRYSPVNDKFGNKFVELRGN